jgi:hypothetical protein
MHYRQRTMLDFRQVVPRFDDFLRLLYGDLD